MTQSIRPIRSLLPLTLRFAFNQKTSLHSKLNIFYLLKSETSTTGAAPNWARRLKTPDSSIADDSYAWANRPLGSRDTNHRDGNKEEEFPSLGSRRKVPSTKRDTNDDPWNSSTSSSSSNPWNQSDSDDGSRRCKLSKKIRRSFFVNYFSL